MRVSVFIILVVIVGYSCGNDTTCPVVLPEVQNRAPVISAQGDTSAVLGDTLRLAVSAVDPEGDDVTYHLTVLLRDTTESDYVADAFLDSHTGEFWFAPGTRDWPERSLMFTAADPHELSMSTFFKVTVSYHVDQVNEDCPSGLLQNLVSYSPMGQEFVPQLAVLDIVQLWLNGSSEFQVNVREGTITGPIVGTSEIATIPPHYRGVVTFEFDRVELIPDDVYVIELKAISGNTMVLSSGGPGSTYPHGRQILKGVPQEGNDLWFRTGAKHPLPPGNSSLTLNKKGFDKAGRL